MRRIRERSFSMTSNWKDIQSVWQREKIQQIYMVNTIWRKPEDLITRWHSRSRLTRRAAAFKTHGDVPGSIPSAPAACRSARSARGAAAAAPHGGRYKLAGNHVKQAIIPGGRCIRTFQKNGSPQVIALIYCHQGLPLTAISHPFLQGVAPWSCLSCC